MTEAERIERLEVQVQALRSVISGLMASDMRCLITAGKMIQGNTQEVSSNIDEIEKYHDEIDAMLEKAFGEAQNG